MMILRLSFYKWKAKNVGEFISLGNVFFIYSIIVFENSRYSIFDVVDFSFSNEELPRYSSGNFTDADVGESIMDVILDVGDVLYLPRGYIHQATTVDDCHSLHITISAFQRNAWIDLLEKVTFFKYCETFFIIQLSKMNI